MCARRTVQAVRQNGLNLEQVESKLPETTGERVAGIVTEKAAVEDAEQ